MPSLNMAISIPLASMQGLDIANQISDQNMAWTLTAFHLGKFTNKCVIIRDIYCTSHLYRMDRIMLDRYLIVCVCL